MRRHAVRPSISERFELSPSGYGPSLISVRQPLGLSLDVLNDSDRRPHGWRIRCFAAM